MEKEGSSYHYFLLTEDHDPIWVCSSEVLITKKLDLYSYINYDFDFFWNAFRESPLPSDLEEGFETLINLDSQKVYFLKLILANTVVIKCPIGGCRFKFIF